MPCSLVAPLPRRRGGGFGEPRRHAQQCQDGGRAACGHLPVQQPDRALYKAVHDALEAQRIEQRQDTDEVLCVGAGTRNQSAVRSIERHRCRGDWKVLY